jgi:hypothetical protein
MYSPDIYAPEFELGADLLIDPDGARLPADDVQAAELAVGNGRRRPDERVPVG